MIPPTIVLGPFVIRIEEVSATFAPDGRLKAYLHDEQSYGVTAAIERCKPAGDAMGMFNKASLTIFLRADLPWERKIQTLAHELGHAWAELFDETNNERVACNYAAFLLTLCPIFYQLRWNMAGDDQEGR